MRKRRIWPIILISAVLVVCAFFVGVMSARGWDFTWLGTSKYQTKTHEITEDFSKIYIFTKFFNFF